MVLELNTFFRIAQGKDDDTQFHIDTQQGTLKEGPLGFFTTGTKKDLANLQVIDEFRKALEQDPIYGKATGTFNIDTLLRDASASKAPLTAKLIKQVKTHYDRLTLDREMETVFNGTRLPEGFKTAFTIFLNEHKLRPSDPASLNRAIDAFIRNRMLDFGTFMSTLSLGLCDTDQQELFDRMLDKTSRQAMLKDFMAGKAPADFQYDAFVTYAKEQTKTLRSVISQLDKNICKALLDDPGLMRHAQVRIDATPGDVPTKQLADRITSIVRNDSLDAVVQRAINDGMSGMEKPMTEKDQALLATIMKDVALTSKPSAGYGRSDQYALLQLMAASGPELVDAANKAEGHVLSEDALVAILSGGKTDLPKDDGTGLAARCSKALTETYARASIIEPNGIPDRNALSGMLRSMPGLTFTTLMAMTEPGARLTTMSDALRPLPTDLEDADPTSYFESHGQGSTLNVRLSDKTTTFTARNPDDHADLPRMLLDLCKANKAVPPRRTDSKNDLEDDAEDLNTDETSKGEIEPPDDGKDVKATDDGDMNVSFDDGDEPDPNGMDLPQYRTAMKLLGQHALDIVRTLAKLFPGCHVPDQVKIATTIEAYGNTDLRVTIKSDDRGPLRFSQILIVDMEGNVTKQQCEVERPALNPPSGIQDDNNAGPSTKSDVLSDADRNRILNAVIDRRNAESAKAKLLHALDSVWKTDNPTLPKQDYDTLAGAIKEAGFDPTKAGFEDTTFGKLIMDTLRQDIARPDFRESPSAFAKAVDRAVGKAVTALDVMVDDYAKRYMNRHGGNLPVGVHEHAIRNELARMLRAGDDMTNVDRTLDGYIGHATAAKSIGKDLADRIAMPSGTMSGGLNAGPLTEAFLRMRLNKDTPIDQWPRMADDIVTLVKGLDPRPSSAQEVIDTVGGWLTDDHAAQLAACGGNPDKIKALQATFNGMFASVPRQENGRTDDTASGPSLDRNADEPDIGTNGQPQPKKADAGPLHAVTSLETQKRSGLPSRHYKALVDALTKAGFNPKGKNFTGTLFGKRIMDTLRREITDLDPEHLDEFERIAEKVATQARNDLEAKADAKVNEYHAKYAPLPNGVTDKDLKREFVTRLSRTLADKNTPETDPDTDSLPPTNVPKNSESTGTASKDEVIDTSTPTKPNVVDQGNAPNTTVTTMQRDTALQPLTSTGLIGTETALSLLDEGTNGVGDDLRNYVLKELNLYFTGTGSGAVMIKDRKLTKDNVETHLKDKIREYVTQGEKAFHIKHVVDTARGMLDDTITAQVQESSRNDVKILVKARFDDETFVRGFVDKADTQGLETALADAVGKTAQWYASLPGKTVVPPKPKAVIDPPNAAKDIVPDVICSQGDNTCFIMSLVNALTITENGRKHLRSLFTDDGALRLDGETVAMLKAGPTMSSFETTVADRYKANHDNTFVPGRQGYAEGVAAMFGLGRPNGSSASIGLTDPKAPPCIRLDVMGKVADALNDGQIPILYRGSRANDNGHYMAVVGTYYKGPDDFGLFVNDSATRTQREISLTTVSPSKNDVFEIQLFTLEQPSDSDMA